MAPGLIERIQAKIELFRLEQRYTRRRHRRSTFVSNAVYVDGEYIYNTPVSTGSSANTSSTTSSSASEKPGKRLNRFSSMPGFGSLSKASGPSPAGQDWRQGRVSVSEVR
ncbi:uncharacterized protein E0L32_005126 [Thyridium curvatum]|uniref:Uncharacterized protein n=1 Tax=Thyridium curvatum TaxID=1093900 RepID=A0A507BCQ5_9PEZI|nr:uncharacterized protein E0L32_005126 [Thyridium curvatum]TPX14731.1 hypothetical protein E0L32_005126 [Thyridium curvatum]